MTDITKLVAGVIFCSLLQVTMDLDGVPDIGNSVNYEEV